MKALIFYVHVPFCSSKCHFCSWVSPIPTSDLVKRQASFGDYARAVMQEVNATPRHWSGMPIAPRLVYFGGGTPSLLDANDLVGILRSILARFPGAPGEAVGATIEMSPDTATPGKLRILREGGFDRISFGVQSFDDVRSRSIGRAHTPRHAVQAFAMARDAGFEDINIDLMIGFPGETDAECDANVAAALGLEPDHLSVYLFKAVQGTVMARQIAGGRLVASAQADIVARYERIARRLAAAGYDEYMFQLFAKNDRRCFIDYHYFHLDHDYVGFGLGAHTFLDGTVWSHLQSLESYLSNPQSNHRQRIADVQSQLETKFFEMLHTGRGIDFARFEAALGLSFAEALRRHPRLQLALDSVLRTGGAERTAEHLRFVDRQARAEWLALPPFWAEPQGQAARRTIDIATAQAS